MYNTKTIMAIYEAQKEAGRIYQGKATNGNRKLGPSIFNINLPPVITCNPKAPCFKECYGKIGQRNFRFKNTINRMYENLFAFCQDPDRFFADIASQTRLSLYCRWFGDGDMPNTRFLQGMVDVAKQNPNCKYLTFTKQYPIVNQYVANGGKIPKNLRIVFSCWGDWVPENPYHFPMAWVEFPTCNKNSTKTKPSKLKLELWNHNKEVNKQIPKSCFECPHQCDTCLHCWKMSKRQHVVFKFHR